MNYRYLDYKNANGNYCFWLPEIAIPENDFDYNWCLKTVVAGKQKNKGNLPFEFETDLVAYREIINDGYLYGYNNEQELLKKYEEIIKDKKKIIKILKNSKKINIAPKDLTHDSLTATGVLIEYALKNNFITDKGNYVIINKNNKHTNPSFCAMLDYLGISINKNTLYSITPEKNVIVDYSLVKKLD